MLKSPIRAIVSGRGASLSFVDQAIVSGGSFLSGIVVARALGPLDFGVYVIATMIILEAASLQNALTLQPMIVNGASLSERAFARFFRAHVVLQAGMIAAAAAVVLAIALIWEPLRPVAIPLVLASSAWQAQELCRRALYTRGRMAAAAINNFVSFDVQAVALIMLALAGGMSIESVLWTVAATSLLGVLVGFWQLRGYVGGERDDVRETARETLRLGRWIAGSYSLSAATMGAYPALIAMVSTLKNTAGLGIIRQVVGPVHLLTKPLENYFLPSAARALHQGGTPALTGSCGGRRSSARRSSWSTWAWSWLAASGSSGGCSASSTWSTSTRFGSSCWSSFCGSRMDLPGTVVVDEQAFDDVRAILEALFTAAVLEDLRGTRLWSGFRRRSCTGCGAGRPRRPGPAA